MNDFNYLHELMFLNQPVPYPSKAHEKIKEMLSKDPELLYLFIELLRNEPTFIPFHSTSLKPLDQESTFELWEKYTRMSITGSEFLSAMGQKIKGQLCKIFSSFSANKKPSDKDSKGWASNPTSLPGKWEEKASLAFYDDESDYFYQSLETNKQISQNSKKPSGALKDRPLIFKDAKVRKGPRAK
ncbi:MAG: hypothetical protein LBE38_06945 [Deltaproteobacteria bacterium]|jgi:hypothetical protein|nr:hypothetical protein [Deltaproteobacteria bacterium]